MPDIAVLSPSPAHLSHSSTSLHRFVLASTLLLGSAMQNGHQPHEDPVAEIKEYAKQKAYKVAKDYPAHALMKVASGMAWDARKAEEEGDLRKALDQLTMSTCLIQIVLNGSEYKSDSKPGKRGQFYKEVNDWMTVRALASPPRGDILIVTYSQMGKT